ncbi:MAG: heavy-metal-associated domain-containing protein [Candidatus Methylomirabilales bacterium]
MKWVVVAVIVAFLLLVLFRSLRALTLGQATIHIAHMQTNEDARQVANVLNGLRGVVEARVDLEGQRVRITYRKGTIAVEDVMRALHGAGY